MEGLVITAALPVFVVARDSGEVMKFDSVYDMQHRLERIDIENSEYVAWDSHGRPLRLSVQKPVWLKIGLRLSSISRQGLAERAVEMGPWTGSRYK